MTRRTSPRQSGRMRRRRRPLRFALRWAGRAALAGAALLLASVLLFTVVNPPRGIYMQAEALRLGGIRRDWVAMAEISPHLARAVVGPKSRPISRGPSWRRRTQTSVFTGVST